MIDVAKLLQTRESSHHGGSGIRPKGYYNIYGTAYVLYKVPNIRVHFLTGYHK